MSDTRRYAVWPDPRSRSRALRSWKFGHFQKLRHLQWKLATDHWFLNYGTISKFDVAGFFKFVLISVSRDFELDTVCPSVCTSVRPQSFFDFNEIWNVDEWSRSMSYARRYAVWPDPRTRSRSRALLSWKSGHFQQLSPSPFTMEAGNWQRILKLRHNIEICSGRISYICSSFCVTWLWTWQKRQLRRVDRQSRTWLLFV